MSNPTITDIVHFISLNAQGLRNISKRARLKEWIFQQKADIIFLQETHFSLDIEHLLKNEFDSFDLYQSYGNSNSRGCAILISKKLNANVIDTKKSGRSRWKIYIYKFRIRKYHLLNTKHIRFKRS